MSTLTFDTLKFANRLKAVGVPDKQAEEEAIAIAETVRDVRAEFETKITASSDKLATKQDLQIEIEKTRAEIERTKAELIKWVVSVGVLQTAMIAALIMKLIPG